MSDGSSSTAYIGAVSTESLGPNTRDGLNWSEISGKTQVVISQRTIAGGEGRIRSGGNVRRTAVEEEQGGYRSWRFGNEEEYVNEGAYQEESIVKGGWVS